MGLGQGNECPVKQMRPEQDRRPPRGSLARPPAPHPSAPTPAPLEIPIPEPSVTLSRPVQDVLLGEGAEVPPFLPVVALPPARLAAGSWLCSRGRQDAEPGARLWLTPPGLGCNHRGHPCCPCCSGEGVEGRAHIGLGAEVAERGRGQGLP